MDLEDDVNLDGDDPAMESEGESEANENRQYAEDVEGDEPTMEGGGESGANENGGNGRVADAETEEEEQHFDITLAASHSYMGGALACVAGRAVLEGGARARLPALAHHGAVFPGETVPMLLADAHDAALMHHTLAKDKLFGLLCPDETCTVLSGYGVVCEVFEAALGAPEGGAPGAAPSSVSFKARAVHRFRLVPKRAMPVYLYVRLQYVDVVVLPEVAPAHPLRLARLAALDARRRPHAPANQQDAVVRRLDAALTPWPGFVFEIFDYARMRNIIHQYFQSLGSGLERVLPPEPVSLSFWVASNLTVAARDRLALLAVDSALLRLHMECRFIAQKSVLCCVTCATEIAVREHATTMSSDGLHGNYTNPGGFVHDVLTVSAARNTRAAGPPSAEFSWFPGYSWSVLVCACCSQHVGWRFAARRRALRPRTFYALCRNYVVPRDAEPPHAAPL